MSIKNEFVLHGTPTSREAMVRYKQAYVNAVQAGRYTFKFEGQEVLVAYAKFIVAEAEAAVKEKP